MMENAYLLAEVGADTAENERNFAEISPKIGNDPTGPLRGRVGEDGRVPERAARDHDRVRADVPEEVPGAGSFGRRGSQPVNLHFLIR